MIPEKLLVLEAFESIEKKNSTSSFILNKSLHFHFTALSAAFVRAANKT